MRTKKREQMIEIPLGEYKQLVEELAKTKISLMRKTEELYAMRLGLKQASNELEETTLFGRSNTRLSDMCEQIVIELGNYRRPYGREGR